MNKTILLIFLVISFFSTSAVWADSDSLCSAEENTLFSCSIGKKLVSVCSSKDLSRASGYVQYRFGIRNRVPELVYPAEKAHPASKFSFGYDGAAKWSLYNLHFTLSGYSYTIYQYSAAFDIEGSGVRVKTPAGESYNLKCQKDPSNSNLDALDDLGLRRLPLEALVSLESKGTWPAESPNVDLLQGVRTHDFALVTKALANGADVNFHGPYDVGVLGALSDERSQAIRLKRVEQFDAETDRLLELLLSRGASPKISTPNGGTAIDFLANGTPYRTIQKLLDIGWPNDYHYRLYVGAMLGNPALVEEALSHGADPNKPIRDSRHVLSAITRASSLSERGEEKEQAQALAALELLLKAGAKIDEGTPTRVRGGDIILVYSYFGNRPNIRPVLDLLIRYASPTACKNSLNWLKTGSVGSNPERQANLDWLLKRLAQ
jgi:hypothetical protein